MGLTLLSQPAHAVATVTVNSVTYDVTVFQGTYDDNVSRFNVGEMPWFGNQALANDFALAVYGLTPAIPVNGGLAGNSPAPGGFDYGLGPLFAWKVETLTDPFLPPTTQVFSSAVSLNETASGVTVGQLDNYPAFSATSFSYATATPVAVPFESDALPIIGSAIFMAGGVWAKRKFAKPLNKA